MAIPADNRRLVEGALHPAVLAAIAAGLGTAWANHAAACAARAYADRDTADGLSLDLAVPFRDLSFPVGAEAAATRLGARDLLVDLTLPGPFGRTIHRLAIPSWMAGGIKPEDEATSPIPDEDGWRFQLGERRFVYGRWGLSPAV